MSQQYKISQSLDEASQNFSSRPPSKQNIDNYHNNSQHQSFFNKYSHHNDQSQPINKLTRIENQVNSEVDESHEEILHDEINAKVINSVAVHRQEQQIKNERIVDSRLVSNQSFVQPVESIITVRKQQSVGRVQSMPVSVNQTGNVKVNTHNNTNMNINANRNTNMNMMPQQQVLRHTIANQTSSGNVMNSQKSINIQNGQMRISLPSNAQQNQFMDRRLVMTPNYQQKTSVSHYQSSHQTNLPQTVNNRYQEQHTINQQQQGRNNVFVNQQTNVFQNANRLPNPSNVNVRPKDFIQGQTQLEKSQIVYRNRKQVHQNQIMQNQRRNLHQQQRNSVGHQNYHRSSSVSPNIKFNYNLTESTTNLNQNVRPIYPNPNMVNPQQLNQVFPTPPTNYVNSNPVTAKNIQPLRIVQESIRTQAPKTKTVTTTSINWEQKYFSVYSRLEHFSSIFQVIVSDFSSFERNLQNLDDQKILKATISKHKKISEKINDLQQQISTLIHEEKPSSAPNIGIVQQKYQRLLQNYAKFHEEHNRMKVSFQKKINQSIKSLQTQNSTLRQQLNQISNSHNVMQSTQSTQQFAQEVAEMTQQIKEMKQYISSLQQRSTSNQQANTQNQRFQDIIMRKDQEIQHLTSIINISNSQPHEKLLQLSQELALTIQQKQKIGEKLAQAYQKNTILQSQIQRISQQSLNISTSIRAKDLQINKLKEGYNTQSLNMQTKNTVADTSRFEQKIRQLESIINELSRQLSKKGSQNGQFLKMSTQIQRLKHYEELILKTTKSITQIQFQNAKLIQKNKLLADQLQRLNQKIQKLSSNQVLESKSPTIVHQQSTTSVNKQVITQYEFTINLLRTQVSRRQEQIQRQARLFDQRVKDLTDQLKIAYNDRQHTHKKHLQKIDSLEKEIEKKQDKIKDLRDKILQYEQQKKINSFSVSNQARDISQSDNIKYESNQIMKLNGEIQKLRRLQNQKEKDIKKYIEEIQILESQVSQYRQQNSALKRQTSDFSNASFELQTLNQVLSKKNMEILELKSKLFQKETFVIQNSNLRKQNQRICEQNLKMSSQIQNLNQSQLLLSKNLRQIQSTQIFSLNQKIQNLENQYNLVLQINGRKDIQISKLRQNNNLLTTNVEELQQQQNRLKHQWKNFQKDVLREKQQFTVQVQKLERRVSEYEKVVLERSVLEHKLTESQRNLNNYKFDNQKMDQVLKQLKQKVKNLQSQNQDFSSQIQSLNQKLKEAEKKYVELAKKNKKAIDELHEKNKQLHSEKTKMQKGKILELQNSIKHKDNKIWKLQKQLEEMHQRFDQFAEQNYDENKIFHLQQKVKEYQARLFSQNLGKIGVKAPDYQASQIFQRKIIYQLKEENDRLREFVNGRYSRPTKGRNSSRSDLEVVQQVHDQEMEEVQKRLVDFNVKLQQLIQGQSMEINTQYQQSKISGLNQSPKKFKSPMKSPIKNFNVSNINITSTEAYQVREMKIMYIELQKYCNNLQAQVLTNQKVSKKGTETLVTEQLNYHKEKNRQLQERVDQLLVINRQLKQNLEKLLKNGSGSNSNSSSYYVQQVSQLKIQITSFQSKIKKLLDQNRILKSQLTQKQGTSSADKGFQLQSKISQLNRKISQFSYIKSSLQKQIQDLKYELKVKSEEVVSLKNSMQLSSNKESSLINENRQKIDDYQMQITRLTNKSRISQSQIQRLNEVIKKKQSQGSDEAFKWKTKVEQLQEELNRFRKSLQQQQNGQGNMKGQISRLVAQIRSLQFQLQTLTQTNNQLSKKLQDSDNKNRDLNTQLSEITNQFRSRKASESQWQAQLEQYLIQITKLKNQIAFLNAEIQRLTEDYKKKQSSYESQLQILQSRASQFQYENMNARKVSGTWENSKQEYETDIARYKNQLAFLQAEMQRLSEQFNMKQQSYQTQISGLRSKFSMLQYQSSSFKNTSSSWQSSRNQYEQTIAQLRSKISLLSSQLERVESTSSSWQSSRQQYERDIANYKNQLAFLNAQIQRFNQQFLRKQQNYKLQIQNFRSKLSQLEYENSSIRGNTNSWQSSREEYQRTIAQLKNQVSIINAELQRVNMSWSHKNEELNALYQASLRQIEQLRGIISQLQFKISGLQSRLNGSMASNQQLNALRAQNLHIKQQLVISQQQTQSLILQIQQIHYKVELIRSIYIQVDTLVQEQQTISQQQFVYVKERVFKQIGKGLFVCEEIFQ